MKPRRKTHLDFETFGVVDLPKTGTSRYAKDKATEVLMCAWGDHDDEKIEQWVPTESIGTVEDYIAHDRYQKALCRDMPRGLRDVIEDPEVVKIAHNASFEISVIRDTLGMEVAHDEWRCTMAMALTLSFPGSLAEATAIAGLPETKQEGGKALVRYWTMPRKPTKTITRVRNRPEHDPEKWRKFKSYNRQDVRAERCFYGWASQWDLPRFEWETWFMDQDINFAGIPVNLARVKNAIALTDKILGKRVAAMKKLTGLDNPMSGDQLLPWLQNRGYRFLDIKKGHIARAKEAIVEADKRDGYDRPSRITGVLGLRQEVSKASVKKYFALRDATDTDGFLRYAIQFAAAARTWRFGGRKFQPQNLMRPPKFFEKIQVQLAGHIESMTFDEFENEYMRAKDGVSPMDALGCGVRLSVEAPDGYVFIDADSNAIENRVLGWMADDRKILQVFEKGLDPYIAFAVLMFKTAYEKLWEEYKPADKAKKGEGSKRTIAKPAVLGCLGGLTRVLTPRGWVRIVEVSKEDRVYDGKDWVEHEGVIFQGPRNCINVMGVIITPDHKIYMGDDDSLPANRFSTSGDVGVCNTFDILNAGPRHRFTVLSERGPLVVSNCGYALGAGREFENSQTGEIEASGLLGYAWNMGVKLTMEQAETSVALWRNEFSDAVDYWTEIIKAAFKCVRRDVITHAGPISFDLDGPFLRMRLPSGHNLHYYKPKILDRKTPWGEIRPTLTYMGKNQKTNQWERVSTHYGKVTENADQAISRDILVHGMKIAIRRGLDIRLHIHDQALALVREDRAERSLKILKESLSEVPKWAPGLPLATAGHISKVFIKD